MRKLERSEISERAQHLKMQENTSIYNFVLTIVCVLIAMVNVSTES